MRINAFETPAGSNLGEHYQILYIQSSAPDDVRKHRPKHVGLTWNNKLVYIVHLVGYFRSCITMHGFMNVKPTEYAVIFFLSLQVRASSYNSNNSTN